MKLKQYLKSTGFAIAFCNIGSMQANEVEPDLCKETEHVYFSCASQEKIISVCSAKRSYDGYWYLAYRFGESHSEIEIEISAEAQDFNDHFTFAYSGYAKGSTYELSVYNPPLTYLVHADTHAFRSDAAGTFVFNNQEVETYYSCNNSRLKTEGSHQLYDLAREGFPAQEASHIGTPGP